MYKPEYSRSDIADILKSNVQNIKSCISSIPGAHKWDNNIQSAFQLYDLMESTTDLAIRDAYLKALRSNNIGYILSETYTVLPPTSAPIPVPKQQHYQQHKVQLQFQVQFSHILPIQMQVEDNLYNKSMTYDQIVTVLHPHVYEICHYLINNADLPRHYINFRADQLYTHIKNNKFDLTLIFYYKQVLGLYNIDYILARPLSCNNNTILGHHVSKEIYIGKCKKCNLNDRQIVYIPCGHCITCEDCASKKSCLQCGTLITDQVRLRLE